MGFWEQVQKAAANADFTKKEPEGQRSLFLLNFSRLGRGHFEI